MLWPLVLLSACGSVVLIPPLYPDWDGYRDACTMLDEPVEIADDAPSATGFTAEEAVDLLDGFELDATYDDKDSEDPLLSERVRIRAERVGAPALFVDRTELAPGIMGPLPDYRCLMGPLIRVPLALRWSTTTPEGEVAWWSAVREIEFASATDPDEVAVYLDIDLYEGDAIDPALAAWADGWREPGEFPYWISLTAWGSLAQARVLGLGVLFEKGDEKHFTHRQLTLRDGTWVAAPQEGGP